MMKGMKYMSKNKYKQLIHPDLKKIAIKLPYNSGFLRIASRVQTLLLKATPVPKGIQTHTYKVKGYRELTVPVEVFEPKQANGKMPCLLYIHGGGFGYKAAPHHKRLACIYAQNANCRVVFPDYHLLPKHAFPAAYEDVIAVYEWLCHNAETLMIDRNHIAVAGDSAGAALAANLCNSTEKRGLQIPCCQLLIYPVIDAVMQTESMKKYVDTPMWNTVNNRKMWDMYLAHATPDERISASPMQNNLPKQMPDTYIETAEFDCLHDEGILYSKRLKEAGINVTVYETQGTIHGYDAVIGSAITKAGVKKRLKFLKAAFI